MISSTRLAKWYLSLMPVNPPALYSQRGQLELALMEYNSEASYQDSFLSNFPGLSPAGKDILDIGCGCGGRMVRFAELGAKSVTGLDVQDDMIEEARRFAGSKGIPATVIKGVGEDMPFADQSFDAIYSYDVFEHVAHLPTVLRECFRTLRQGGTLYAVFPPVHHPLGGSHFHGYLSKSPAPNVLFRPKALIAAAYQMLEERGQSYRPKMRSTDYLPSVNGTTVSDFRRYVRDTRFSNASIVCRPLHLPGSLSFVRPVLSALVHVPFLREVTTSRVIAALTR